MDETRAPQPGILHAVRMAFLNDIVSRSPLRERANIRSALSMLCREHPTGADMMLSLARYAVDKGVSSVVVHALERNYSEILSGADAQVRADPNSPERAVFDSRLDTMLRLYRV